MRAAQITAVGAFETAVVGWYDRDARDYRRIPVDEQSEVLSLVGDVAEGEDGPAAHVHTVLGLADGSTRGGHLLEARVWPTLEVVLRTSPATLRKTYRPEVGLASSAPSGGGQAGSPPAGGRRAAEGPARETASARTAPGECDEVVAPTRAACRRSRLSGAPCGSAVPAVRRNARGSRPAPRSATGPPAGD